MKTAVIFIGLMVTIAMPVNAGIMEDIPKFIHECVGEKKATQESLQTIGKLENFTSPDVTSALLCIAQKAGVIDGNGKFNLDTLVADIVESHKFDDRTADTLKAFAADCVNKAEQQGTPQAKVGDLAKCMSALIRKE